MIEKRVAQLEADVRNVTSRVAKLEAEAHAQSAEMQQAIQGLARQVADLRMRVEEMRDIGSVVYALS